MAITMEKTRHTGLDLLRILSALGVVLIHVSAPFVTSNMKVLNEAFWAGNLFNALGRFSVPIFVVVSGFFLIRPIDSLKEFYQKRFTRILWPLVCWSVIYLLWAYFFDHTRTFKIWEGLLWGKPYFHLWFLGMLMGLYAVTPLLGDLLKRVGIRKFTYIAIGLLLVAMANDAWDSYAHNRPWFGTWWMPYTGYFMIGACLGSFRGMINRRWLLVSVAAVCYAMVFGLTGWLFACNQYSWYFYSYLSITSIVGSIAMVNLFRLMDVGGGRFIARFSNLTFGIYLVHIIPLNIIKRYWHNTLVENPYLNILLISLVVFAVSILVVWLLSRIKVVKRLML